MEIPCRSAAQINDRIPGCVLATKTSSIPGYQPVTFEKDNFEGSNRILNWKAPRSLNEETIKGITTDPGLSFSVRARVIVAPPDDLTGLARDPESHGASAFVHE